MLSCIRQRLLSPTLLPKLKRRLEELAHQDSTSGSHSEAKAAKTAELSHIQKNLQRTAQNLVLAESPEQYKAMAAVFDKLKQQETEIQEELAQIQPASGQNDPQSEVRSALDFAEDLVDRIGTCDDFAMAANSSNPPMPICFCRFGQ